MINPHKIKYNKMLSSELNVLDLIMCVAFDSDSGEATTFLGREAIASETHDGRYKRTHGYKYNESFSPKFTFMKSNLGDFTIDEVRQVLKWLTSTSTASLLDVYYDDDDAISWSAIGGWTEISTYKLGNNRTVAIVATFEAITPYAMSGLITKKLTENTLTINIETDEPQSPIYPRITIQQDSETSIVEIDHVMTDIDVWTEGTVYHDIVGGKYYWVDEKLVKHVSDTNDSGFETTSVSITNTYTDNNQITRVFNTIVKNNIKDEIIVLDGTNKVVSSSRTNGRLFGDDFDWRWIPLYEGKNNLSFVGNCTVTIEYREVRKVGEF